MLITILLTLCNIILLCLMILTATVFMPYRGLAKNFPKDVQEVFVQTVAHRLELSARAGQREIDEVLQAILQEVPAPRLR